MRRFSQNRQDILDCLAGTDTHPTAEWVYARLKPTHPSLSLATVYRNLTQLKNDGLISSMGVVQGQERFDGNCTSHAHAVCVQCGRMVDVLGFIIPPDMLDSVREATGYKLSGAGLQFTGLCEECQKKES